nr:stage III sporulation protein AB [Lachnospiraceae bacterium]
MKWIGFLLVLAGTAGVGFSLVGEYTLRLRVLEQIKTMMHYINDLILYENACLPEAFRKTSVRMEEPFRGFLQKVAEQTEEFNGEDISFLWKNNGQMVRGHMNKKDYEEFLGCMQQTGFMDVKGQSQTIKAYEQHLELLIHKLSEQKEEKCKLYQTVGIMSGLFVCILLL